MCRKLLKNDGLRHVKLTVTAVVMILLKYIELIKKETYSAAKC